jgi:hypothetical protein
MHCPEAALPVVTVLATVIERGGQLNSGFTLLHYRLQSTVYNSSSRSYHTFPLTAYFKNGQRWVNFPQNINANIFLTGRIFGVTKKNRQLAVITDDIHFFPTLPQSLPSTPSPTTGKRKRQDRWSQRANGHSPFKPAPVLEDDLTSAIQQSYNPTETISLNDDDDDETLITWPDTAEDAQALPRPHTPTPERRSQRPRNKTLC